MPETFAHAAKHKTRVRNTGFMLPMDRNTTPTDKHLRITRFGNTGAKKHKTRVFGDLETRLEGTSTGKNTGAASWADVHGPNPFFGPKSAPRPPFWALFIWKVGIFRAGPESGGEKAREALPKHGRGRS